jgi:hypothetical protein
LLVAPACSLQVVLPLLQQPLRGRFIVPQLMVEVAGCSEVVFQLETRVSSMAAHDRHALARREESAAMHCS